MTAGPDAGEPGNAEPEAGDALRRRLAAELAREGGDWPALRAALAVSRGAARLDVAAAAAELGVSAADVAALERGDVHPSLAPPSLASWAPDVDWRALGVETPLPGDAPAPQRHPAARRPARIRVRARPPP